MIMAGAPVIAAFIAHVAFWVLLVTGLLFGAIRTRGAVVYLVLWGVGYSVLSRLGTSEFVAPWLAILDITLVFIVFKGDARIT